MSRGNFLYLVSVSSPLTPTQCWTFLQQRNLGWREALAENGRDVGESYVTSGDWTLGNGKRSICMLLEWHPEMDAVFVCNEQMALSAMKAAQQLGRQIPQDWAIVGYENIPEAAYFTPALTTVRQGIPELGRQEVNRLIALINDKGDSSTSSITVQPELIIQESSTNNA